MQDSCFYHPCDKPLFYECPCAFPILVFCEEHGQYHISRFQEGHNLRLKLPCLGSTKKFRISSDRENSKVVLANVDEKLFAMKINNKKVGLHPEIANCVNAMKMKFVKILAKIGKNDDKELKKICQEYVEGYKKVIANSKVDENEFYMGIQDLVNQSYSLQDEEAVKKVSEIVGKIKKEMDMPAKVKKFLVQEYSLSDCDNNFYLKLLMEQDFSKENLSKLFKKEYKYFISHEDVVDRHFDSISGELFKLTNDIKRRLSDEAFSYISSLNTSDVYSQISVYISDISDELTKSASDICPDWNLVYTAFMQNSDFEIKQCLDISDNLCFVISDLKQNLSFIILISEMISYNCLTIQSIDFLLLSGSTKATIPIIQSNPLTINLYTLDSRTFEFTHYLSLPIPNSNFIYTSGALIDNWNTLILCSKNGNYLCYDINSEVESNKLSETISEPIYQVEYLLHIQILFIKTSSSMLLYTATLEPYKSFAYPSGIFSVCLLPTSLYILILKTSKFKASQIELQEEDITHFNKQIPGWDIKGRFSRYVKRNYNVLDFSLYESTNKYDKIIEKINFLEVSNSPIYLDVEKNKLTPREYIKKTKKLEIYDIIEEKKEFGPGICYNSCSLCSLSCQIKTIHSYHLCDNLHKCAITCSALGNCNKNGKFECGRDIGKGQIAHEGVHECQAEYHLCPYICPGCGVQCKRVYGHEDNHKKKHHLKLYFGLSCGQNCGYEQHVHQVRCPGEEYCPKKYFPEIVEHGDDFDYWKDCKEFWKYYAWDVDIN
ncbi:hypothetical protein SteCoe_17316 [Stentor coeruleus]|uniref:Uncharacterized protein n=1 Tax=Stentor coeruleus TaxID=5963 RepID=A0A1R2BZA0_9CILI|nr:hypothetical protein SteCoe_17316 [Stentor coeruleus]